MVKRAICDRGKAGVMLDPTARSLSWMGDRALDNCLQHMDAAPRYGEM